jgi:hypothetical protein
MKTYQIEQLDQLVARRWGDAGIRSGWKFGQLGKPFQNVVGAGFVAQAGQIDLPMLERAGGRVVRSVGLNPRVVHKHGSREQPGSC